jgi:hypothetical protein
MASPRRTARSPVRMRDRLRIFALLAVVLVAVHAGYGAYRWLAFAEERAQLRALNAQVDSAGFQVIRTQLRVDTLEQRIGGMDRELEEVRSALARFGAHEVDGALPPALHAQYRAEIARYNRRVELRNGWFARWQAAVRNNATAVRRYNRLADSIRSVAARMGEPYYNIPSPVEAAVRQGLRPDGTVDVSALPAPPAGY